MSFELILDIYFFFKKTKLKYEKKMKKKYRQATTQKDIQYCNEQLAKYEDLVIKQIDNLDIMKNEKEMLKDHFVKGLTWEHALTVNGIIKVDDDYDDDEDDDDETVKRERKKQKEFLNAVRLNMKHYENLLDRL